MANRILGGEDDDEQAYYDKIPDYVKNMNWVFMYPDGSGRYLKVPLPYGYNVLHVIGQQLGTGLAAALGRRQRWSPADGAFSIVAAALDAFNPLGGSPSLLQLIAPTITDPVVQIAENQDFAGRKIVPEGNPFDRTPDPASSRYWGSTSEPSKVIARDLNRLTGGSDLRPGAVDIAPGTLDHWFEFA